MRNFFMRALRALRLDPVRGNYKNAKAWRTKFAKGFDYYRQGDQIRHIAHSMIQENWDTYVRELTPYYAAKLAKAGWTFRIEPPNIKQRIKLFRWWIASQNNMEREARKLESKHA